MRKTIEEYGITEIHNALYHCKFLRGLWADEMKEAKRLFAKHSNNSLKIPIIWAPIIKKLIKELVRIDPNVRIIQIKEDLGRLHVHIKPSLLHENLAQLTILGATVAINAITLIQLKTTSNGWIYDKT